MGGRVRELQGCPSTYLRMVLLTGPVWHSQEGMPKGRK